MESPSNVYCIDSKTLTVQILRYCTKYGVNSPYSPTVFQEGLKILFLQKQPYPQSNFHYTCDLFFTKLLVAVCYYLFKAKPAGVCENDEFFCGQMPVESSKISYTHEKRSVPDINEIKSSHVQEFNDPMTATTTTEKHLMYKVQQSLLKFKSIKQKTRRSFIQNDDYGYCISKQLQCDSIVHCHNARDELPSLRMNPTDLPGQLLRALVGAHLTPADLNNVGCTVYKLSSSTIIQSYNNEKHKGIQISNTDESQGGSKYF
ncbi:unnamed protein product [Trichobilharzia regenti]|nr:unnamed protein product [Trichobilharzia regenti]